MTKDEALDLALEALELHGKQYPHMVKGYCLDAITAIKQALAIDKMADNARDLGLDYEPDYKVTVVDNQHPNGVPLEQWGRVAEQGEERMKKLIKDLISAMEYHVEQTRPIHSTTVALQAAREAIRAQPAPVQEPVAWKWQPAPVKTSWGHEMVVADLAIDKDHTVSVYCERDQTVKVEAMFTPPAQPAPVQEPVIFYRCNGCGHAYEEIPPTSCDCMDGGGFNRVDYYTTPLAQRPWVGLTDEEILEAAGIDGADTWLFETAYAIEAKLKEKNT